MTYLLIQYREPSQNCFQFKQQRKFFVIMMNTYRMIYHFRQFFLEYILWHFLSNMYGHSPHRNEKSAIIRKNVMTIFLFSILCELLFVAMCKTVLAGLTCSFCLDNVWRSFSCIFPTRFYGRMSFEVSYQYQCWFMVHTIRKHLFYYFTETDG